MDTCRANDRETCCREWVFRHFPEDCKCSASMASSQSA